MHQIVTQHRKSCFSQEYINVLKYIATFFRRWKLFKALFKLDEYDCTCGNEIFQNIESLNNVSKDHFGL
jgi:hypothetical protein